MVSTLTVHPAEGYEHCKLTSIFVSNLHTMQFQFLFAIFIFCQPGKHKFQIKIKRLPEPSRQVWNQVRAQGFLQSAIMTGMAMHLNFKLPVSNIAASRSTVAKALPRCTSIASAKHSAFFGGSGQHFASARSRCPSQQRSSSLIVEAVKKSVGDLSKGDLEGKVVLVRRPSSAI